jgi:hypothetical protein
VGSSCAKYVPAESPEAVGATSRRCVSFTYKPNIPVSRVRTRSASGKDYGISKSVRQERGFAFAMRRILVSIASGTIAGSHLDLTCNNFNGAVTGKHRPDESRQ